jgi:hypothetical protein
MTSAGQPRPAAQHMLDQHADDVVEGDHARLKATLRPMR